MNTKTRHRILRGWVLGSHRHCRYCGRYLTLDDFFLPGGKFKEGRVGFCGTKGCGKIWWNCPTCGGRV